MTCGCPSFSAPRSRTSMSGRASPVRSGLCVVSWLMEELSQMLEGLPIGVAMLQSIGRK
jgi:hypothetical protein